MWFFVALASAAFYAVAEELDNFFVNNEFRHPFVLVFFSTLFCPLFAGVLFWIWPPAWPPLHTLPIFFLLAVISLSYLYPYYLGLQKDDTSVAISFLALERIFVPIFAFLIIGERLAYSQYFGIALIVLSVIFLGFHRAQPRGSRLSKAVWYIGIAAFILAFEGVLLKILFLDGVTVSTALGGEFLITFIFGLGLLLKPSFKKEVRKAWPLFMRLLPLFAAEEIFTFLGLLSESYAISVTSVSIVKGVTAASPFFLLGYAFLGESFFPKAFKENIRKNRVIQKLLLFILVIAGIILVKQ